MISEDGRYLLLYSNKYNTIYKYEPAKNILSPVMSLERSSNMLYNVWLLSTQSGVLVVDQREDQTVVRILSPDAASWEAHAFDFTAYTMAEAANGRVVFREYHMTLADFEDHDRPEKQEVFHVVDLDSLSVRSSRSLSYLEKHSIQDCFMWSLSIPITNPDSVIMKKAFWVAIKASAAVLGVLLLLEVVVRMCTLNSVRLGPMRH